MDLTLRTSPLILQIQKTLARKGCKTYKIGRNFREKLSRILAKKGGVPPIPALAVEVVSHATVRSRLHRKRYGKKLIHCVERTLK